MERELVSPNELVDILNSEFSKYPEYYPACCFRGTPYKLIDPDREGCNWDVPQVQCSGVSGKSCAHIVSKILTEAKKKYNIK